MRAGERSSPARDRDGRAKARGSVRLTPDQGEVHHDVLARLRRAFAVRTDLANFGAPGLADVDYTAIGFMS